MHGMEKKKEKFALTIAPSECIGVGNPHELKFLIEDVMKNILFIV